MTDTTKNGSGSWAMSCDPREYARMRAEAVNGLQGELTGYDCPKCRNRGYTAYPREDGTFYVVPCDCVKIRHSVREMELSGLKSCISELTFDRFHASHSWQKAAKAGAEQYAADPKGWLLFCGQPGSGKTHLCTAACRQLLLGGRSVRYMSWRDKTAELKTVSLEREARKAIMDDLKKTEILYIDDLFKPIADENGKTFPTKADVGLAFELLNFRYVNRLPTLISTELMPQELVKIDEPTGSRILEMADTHIYAIKRDTNRNYRLRNVKLL